ncbi:hypothetical protein [Methylomonas koyamae]|uniref:hypothetical protein n=1 Tax=Methylomonas koyamae TaxID=702114 RepID=UPI000A5AA107|nr:hypothetical protein [Methylomonas koyamae]
MKTLLIIALITLSGCAMTPEERALWVQNMQSIQNSAAQANSYQPPMLHNFDCTPTYGGGSRCSGF